MILIKDGLTYGKRIKMENYRPKNGTRTSSFGSPGRINHDSSPFYSSRLYDGLPKEEPGEYIEKAVKSQYTDALICKTSENMKNYQITVCI